MGLFGLGGKGGWYPVAAAAAGVEAAAAGGRLWRISWMEDK